MNPKDVYDDEDDYKPFRPEVPSELDFNDEPNPNGVTCALCGHEHEEDDSHVFCEECGMPMDGGDAP